MGIASCTPAQHNAMTTMTMQLNQQYYGTEYTCYTHGSYFFFPARQCKACIASGVCADQMHQLSRHACSLTIASFAHDVKSCILVVCATILCIVVSFYIHLSMKRSTNDIKDCIHEEQYEEELLWTVSLKIICACCF